MNRITRIRDMLPLLPLQRRMVRGGKRRRPLLQLQQRSSSVPMRPILCVSTWRGRSSG